MIRRSRNACLAALFLAWGAGAPMAAAQGLEIDHNVFRASLDSGLVGNAAPEFAVVFSEPVFAPHAPWMRVVFDDVRLEGKSKLRLIATADGEEQVFDSETISQWQNTSAYFNGSIVFVEIIAAPGTTNNRVTISRVLGGTPRFGPGGPGERRICENVDNRVLSADARTCRLLQVRLPVPNCGPEGLPCQPSSAGLCTGFITDTALGDEANNRVMLSAGHCFDLASGTLMTVAQFETIGASDISSCNFSHPPVRKQFAVNTGRYRSENLGPFTGHDWAAFTCFANPNTGNTVFQEQAMTFTLAAANPAAGAALTKFGYGASGPLVHPDPNGSPFCDCLPGHPSAARYGVQQTSAGIVTAPVGPDQVIRHNVHTCGGDSGSPVLNAGGDVVGIHVGGQCGIPGAQPNNAATSIRATHVIDGIATVAADAFPLNSLCANALTITRGTFGFSTVGAGTDGPNETLCDGAGSMGIDNDVWFRYTANSTQTRVSLCGSTFDTRLAIYTGTCPAGPNTALACNDDAQACGNVKRQSEIIFNSTPNVPYLFRVGGFNNASGTGVITVEALGNTVPPTDLCVNATVVMDGATEFSTLGAGTDGPNPTAACGDLNQDVWFRYTATATGNYNIDTCFTQPGFDTRLVVYQGWNCSPPGAEITCGDDECGVQSRTTPALVMGMQYLIRIGGFQDHQGTGILRITPPAAAGQPPNNACASALLVSEGLNSFDSTGATRDGPALAGCGIGQAEADIWFRYSANRTGHIIADTCTDTMFDSVLVGYLNTTCPATGARQQACNDDTAMCGAMGRQSRIRFEVDPGTAYLLRIGGTAAAEAGPGKLRLRFFPNDTIDRAIASGTVAANGVTTYDNTGALTDDPGGALASGAHHELWYIHRATTPGTLRFRATSGRPAIAVYNADFSARLGQDVNAGNAATATVDLTIDNDPGTADPPPGTFFIICVGGNAAGQQGPGTLEIIPNAGGAARPPNDDCANATQAIDGANNFDSSNAVTDGVEEIDCAGINRFFQRDVWYRYTASATGTLVADVGAADPAAFDSRLAAFRGFGCMPVGAALACDDDTWGTPARNPRVRFGVTAGDQVLFRIGALGAGGEGVFRIRILPNDECLGAVQVFNGVTPFDTTLYTTSPPNPVTCGLNPFANLNQDLWMRYVATHTGRTRFSTCGSTFDTRLAVYNSVNCPPMNLVECSDDVAGCAPAGTGSRLTIQSTMGTTYTVRIGGFAANEGPGTLTIQGVCRADVNFDGVVSPQDLFDFMAGYFGNDLDVADVNGSGALTPQDIFDFLASFFAGC